jgi:hypothetical protein
MPPSHDIEKFRSILQSSKNIVAIAGAGLSAASGSIFPGQTVFIINVFDSFDLS